MIFLTKLCPSLPIIWKFQNLVNKKDGNITRVSNNNSPQAGNNLVASRQAGTHLPSGEGSNTPPASPLLSPQGRRWSKGLPGKLRHSPSLRRRQQFFTPGHCSHSSWGRKQFLPGNCSPSSQGSRQFPPGNCSLSLWGRSSSSQAIAHLPHREGSNSPPATAHIPPGEGKQFSPSNCSPSLWGRKQFFPGIYSSFPRGRKR